MFPRFMRQIYNTYFEKFIAYNGQRRRRLREAASIFKLFAPDDKINCKLYFPCHAVRLIGAHNLSFAHNELVFFVLKGPYLCWYREGAGFHGPSCREENDVKSSVPSSTTESLNPTPRGQEFHARVNHCHLHCPSQTFRTGWSRDTGNC